MSNESFLPYGRQTISEADVAAVVDVLNSSFLTQGPVVVEFEKQIASQICSSHAVAVNSATSALHIACLSVGLGPGDSLWTSPTTFVASANCALYCGAKVDFVDIEPKTGLMSIYALKEKLALADQQGTLPKVVIPVHLCGTSCDMQAISSLADRYGFSVIEDASHAIGGYYNGKPIGCCEYSLLTVFSFHPVKIITTGEGGLVATNSQELARKLEALRSHGITKDPKSFKHPSPGPWGYEQQILGFNYRMTDIQAALGLSQLQRLTQIVSERQRLFSKYQELTEDLSLDFLEIPTDVSSATHLAVVRLSDKSPCHHKRVFIGLRSLGIGVQLHYAPVHLQPYYRWLGFNKGDYPEAEAFACNAISLPLFPGLKEEDQHRVVNALSTLLA